MSYLATFTVPKVVSDRSPKEVNEQVDNLRSVIAQRYNDIKTHGELKNSPTWRICKGESNKILFEIIAEQENAYVYAKNHGTISDLQKAMKESRECANHNEYLHHLRDLSKGVYTVVGVKRPSGNHPEKPNKIAKTESAPNTGKEQKQSELVDVRKLSDDVLIREVHRRFQTGDILLRMTSKSNFAKIKAHLTHLKSNVQTNESKEKQDVVDLTERSDEEDSDTLLGETDK